ncbi:MAG: Hsp20/alpha crystallin family protein [Kiloniellales bacterium]
MTEKKTEETPSVPSLFSGTSMFKSLQDEMDRMFHAFAMPQMSWRSAAAPGNGAMGLRVDIGESDKEIHIEADLPGVPEEAVEVTLDDDILRIHAERKEESEKSEKDWRVVERSRGTFERSIRMPAGIDPDKVEAHFEKGVLKVTLPKPPETQASAHRIPVKKAS